MGPLNGIRVIEIAGIGPAPYAAMLLSDLGADVIRVDRTTGGALGTWPYPRFDVLSRGRRSIAVDLKNERALEVVLGLVDGADALIEGFRPGVAERLGIGPDDCLARNPRLVYGRMTGWGQEGPLAQAAGHDLNYIALTGALHCIGRSDDDPPAVPLNLVGDFGGGSMFLVMGVLAALLEAKGSGKGQVVDAAMVDGASSLMSWAFGATAVGFWNERRSSNMLDGGAYFYDTYETKDGKYVAVGAIEAQFHAELLRLVGLEDEELPGQFDTADWPAMRERMAAIFKTKTREQWCEIMEGTDACFAPILTLTEAPEHPHLRARGTFVEVDGVAQPAPAPRFSRTEARVQRPPVQIGTDTDAILTEAGYSVEQIASLHEQGAVVGPPS